MCPTSVAAFRFPRLGWKHGSTVRMAASMAELLSPWESLVQTKSEIQRFIWNRFCYQRSICLAVQAVKSTEKITLANLSLQCPLNQQVTPALICHSFKAGVLPQHQHESSQRRWTHCQYVGRTQTPASIEMKKISDKHHKPSNNYEYSKTEHTYLNLLYTL